jgi:adenylate cyclase
LIALVMNPGRPEEQSFPIAPGTVTIGRTKDNAIFCVHKSLSRKHAQLDYDGSRLRVTDLQSKNGIFFNGRRVGRCEVGEGESFRCGDITFLVEGSTAKQPRASVALDRAAQTLPSPFAVDASVSRRPTAHPQPHVVVEDDQRFKDKLFLLIRASELCVSEMTIDRILDELIVLAVQVLAVDRIVLLTLDDVSLMMKPRVTKTFAPTSSDQPPYSRRVVDWIVDHGSPASFADVSRDRSLPGDPHPDAKVKSAMCVPINPGGGTIGAIYADSLSRTDSFRPDDLALLRALANLAAVAIESAALRSGDRGAAGGTATTVLSPRR